MLYVVATPIGNLEDITLRALRVLKEVDAILCEDTRVTKKLLAHYSILKPLISYHQHSGFQKEEDIIRRLEKGEILALVSDAGTPGVSDPGNMIVAKVHERLPDARIVPVPGPSAMAALASVAGIQMDRFMFLGFPPNKKGRKSFWEKAAQSDIPIVLYESKYRISKTLLDLSAAWKPVHKKEPYIVAGRELTKMFETIYRGTLSEVLFAIEKDVAKGEFTLIVSNLPRN